MFNSLNSTGIPLSDADIISAQLYSNSGNDKERFNDSWREINKLADELNTRKIVNIDSILQQFMYINRAINKEYIKNDSVDVTTPGLRRYYIDIKKELLNTPLSLCEELMKLVETWNIIKEYPIVKLLLKFNENAKLYLSDYLCRFKPDEISQENILEISECLLRLFTILELVDAGYSSKNFKTFLFSEIIKLVDKNISMDDIKENFNIHIAKNWCKDNIIGTILEYDKNILVYLNEYLYSKIENVKFDFDDNVNVEHIVPASGRNISSIQKDAGINDKEEFDLIVCKIGNKILLEEEINKSIGNEWFKTKKQNSINSKHGYKDSRYAIATSMTRFSKDTWGKEDIIETTQKITERISKFIFD